MPEFFFDPTFLLNINNADLGEDLVQKIPINDVELPKWAESPREFVLFNYKILDSEDITPWINLIFGIN